MKRGFLSGDFGSPTSFDSWIQYLAKKSEDLKNVCLRHSYKPHCESCICDCECGTYDKPHASDCPVDLRREN